LALGGPGGFRGGRVSEDVDPYFARLSSSMDQDREIFHCDVWNSIVHTMALERAGELDENTAIRILEGLVEVLRDGYEALPDAEDVHEAVESALSERIGDEAGWLQLGRSRNDQVATDVRIRMRERIVESCTALLNLAETLVSKAEETADVVLASYTHLKRAQPCTLGFWLSSYVPLVLSGAKVLLEVPGSDECPLGCSAATGSTVPVDRHWEAIMLGFDRPSVHCGEATGFRRPVLWALSALSVVSSDLTRLATDTIFLSSDEVGVLEPPDETSSTSSVMPHKKNPDAAELARAELKAVQSLADAALRINDDLPSFYDRDLQVINGLLWEAFDRFTLAVRVLARTIRDSRVDEEAAERTVLESHVMAVDLAEGIAREEGIPFREAHRIVGRVTAKLAEEDIPLNPDTVEAVARALREEGVEMPERALRSLLNPERALRRPVAGSTHPGRLRFTLEGLRRDVKAVESRIDSLASRHERALELTDARLRGRGVEGFLEAYRGYARGLDRGSRPG